MRRARRFIGTNRDVDDEIDLLADQYVERGGNFVRIQKFYPPRFNLEILGAFYHAYGFKIVQGRNSIHCKSQN